MLAGRSSHFPRPLRNVTLISLDHLRKWQWKHCQIQEKSPLSEREAGSFNLVFEGPFGRRPERTKFAEPSGDRARRFIQRRSSTSTIHLYSRPFTKISKSVQ